MNTARLVVVTAVATFALIAIGSAATAGGGTGTPTSVAPSSTLPVAPIDGPGPDTRAGGIGFDEASRIALDRDGGGRVTDAEWDLERGRRVWEIEVCHGAAEHEVRLDADSGALLRHERDGWDDDCL